MISLPPRRSWALAGCLALSLAAAGCSGSSLDQSSDSDDGVIRIGLLVPQSGSYQVYGPEILEGFQLYLDTHDNQLGGHEAEIVVADEGNGDQTAINSGKKLIQQDQVDALVGTTTVDSLLGLASVLGEAGIPFIGTGGRPSTLTDISHIWHTSWQSTDAGAAIAGYLLENIDGPVYAIGPDYQGGYDQIGGFVDTYTAAGGELANGDGEATWTPWPSTTNFLPYINEIASSGAKAVYAFFPGSAAAAFVQQYAQAGLQNKIPLYGSNLTDETILETEGASADGVWSVMNYAANLDNEANREFVTSFPESQATNPQIFNVTAWDAALILDQAIAAADAAGEVTPETINTAIGEVGQVDSPRGVWRWSASHTPIQAWYLRQVATDGTTRANVLVQTLTTLGE